MNPYVLKLKISESQEEILRPAIKSLKSSMFRFDTPSLVEGTLMMDPFDFAQLVTYMERNFKNEMEVFRLKKIARDELMTKQARCKKASSREAYRQMIDMLEHVKPKTSGNASL